MRLPVLFAALALAAALPGAALAQTPPPAACLPPPGPALPARPAPGDGGS